MICPFRGKTIQNSWFVLCGINNNWRTASLCCIVRRRSVVSISVARLSSDHSSMRMLWLERQVASDVQWLTRRPEKWVRTWLCRNLGAVLKRLESYGKPWESKVWSDECFRRVVLMAEWCGGMHSMVWWYLYQGNGIHLDEVLCVALPGSELFHAVWFSPKCILMHCTHCPLVDGVMLPGSGLHFQ